MSDEQRNPKPTSDEELEDLVAQIDTGPRNPEGPARKIILSVAAAWSLFQLWIASPIAFHGRVRRIQ